MLYQIKCRKCGAEEEWFCSVSQYEERLKEPCKECGGELFQNMENVSGSFLLKGSGWTRHGSVGRTTRKLGTQEALDDALFENDNLTYMADKKIGDFGKKDDQIKRAIDDALKNGMPTDFA